MDLNVLGKLSIMQWYHLSHIRRNLFSCPVTDIVQNYSVVAMGMTIEGQLP